MHEREVGKLREVGIVRRPKRKGLDKEMILREYFEAFDYVIERDHVRLCLLSS
jgi:hypothetical protein